jgi:hypothetical protein
MPAIQAIGNIVYVNMEELVKDIRNNAFPFESIESRALDLICRKGYDCKQAARELNIRPEEFRLRLREELKSYRG